MKYAVPYDMKHGDRCPYCEQELFVEDGVFQCGGDGEGICSICARDLAASHHAEGRMRYDVRLVHGTYQTIVSVHADDDEEAIAKAKARARRDGFYCLPMAYESAKIIGRSTVE